MGTTPLLVLWIIYEDLQKPTIVDDSFEVKLRGNDIKLKFFLVSFHFFRKYPTKSDRQFIFNCSDHQTRDQVWDILQRIRCLKATKITWPDDLGEDDTEVNLTPLTSKYYVKNKLRKKINIFNTHGIIHNT